MSRKTNYSMREFRELMRRAEEADYWNKMHIVIYADGLPTTYNFEEWDIPIEDVADFINIMCATYDVSSVQISNSRYDYDAIDIDLYNNKISIY